MTRVNPFILKVLRSRKGWSQERLAEIAKVDKQTISRLERGERDVTRENTIKQLARTLDVEPEELTREAPDLAAARESEPVRQKSQFNVSLSDSARNALYLLSERYSIMPWQIMELAPLLFCWAAEKSLRQRRDRVEQLTRALETARSLEHEMPHLPAPNFSYSEEKIAAESYSIEHHDVFGSCIDQDNFIDGCFYPSDEDRENPFAMFLAKLIGDLGEVATFEGFSSIDFPIYRVCSEEASRLVGGDERSAESILDGIAVLNEMPKKLQESPSTMTQERVEWVRAQTAEYLKNLVSFSDLLGKEKEAST